MGEEVTVVVVLAPGAMPDAESVRARAPEESSSFKAPTRVKFVGAEDDLRWLGTGKGDKLALEPRFRKEATP